MMIFSKVRFVLIQYFSVAILFFFSVSSLSDEAKENAEESSLPAMPSSSWSVGFAVIDADPSYRGDTSNTLAVPIINYESERLYFRGIELGYRLTEPRPASGAPSLTAIARVVPSSFDPTKNRLAELQELDKRAFRVETGFNYRYRAQFGDFNSEITVNARDLSSGFRSSVRYEYGFSDIPFVWQFGPRLGVEYFSAEYVNYFYGISPIEAQRSGLMEYRPNDSWNLTAGVGGYIRLGPRWTLGGQWNRTFVDSNITNSPMTSNRDIYTTFLFVTYRLGAE